MRLVVAVLCGVCALALAGAPSAVAGVGGAVVPQLTPRPAADGVSTGQLALFNKNTAPNAGQADVVNQITLLPSCGDTATPCATPDPGVLAVDPRGGSGSGACAGSAFSFSAPDPDTGRIVITPATSLRLDPGTSCVITFKFRVLKLPAHPEHGRPAGTTRQIAGAQFDDPTSGLSAVVSGAGDTTFAPAMVLGAPAPPTCKLKPSGSTLQITASTKGKLSALKLVGSRNARVKLPKLRAGTRSSATATLSQSRAQRSAQAALTVTDSIGQATRCRAAVVSTARQGKSQQLQLAGLAKAEHFLTVVNGSPPLDQLAITVDGRKLATIKGLKAKRSRAITFAARATRRSNAVALRASAGQAALAYVLISDAR